MVLAFDLSGPIAVLGLIVGMTYGIFAIGLVLVYRSSRVINFAQGAIGMVAAATFGVTVQKWSVPYFLALPVAVLLGAGTGLLTEVAVMRRLREAPTVVKVVATIGFAAFLQVFALAIGSTASFDARYPSPPWFPEFELGSLHVSRSYSAMLVLTPLIVLALVWLMQMTRVGLAVRGSAGDPDVARLSGISAASMSALTWGLAGGLTSYAAVLLYPTLGFAAPQSFGPDMLLRALVAAVIARMASLPVAFGVALVIGVIEQETLFNGATGAEVNAILLVLILVALLGQYRTGTAREEEPGDWMLVQPWSPLPERLREVRTIRVLGWAGAAAAVAGAIVLGALVTNSVVITLSAIVSMAVIGLGVSVISGLAGQLSLGQFAIAGVASTASYLVTEHIANFLIAFLAAGATGATVAVILGIPSIRIRGVMYAVTTLAFAQAVPWILEREALFGDQVSPQPLSVFGLDVSDPRTYYFFSVAIATTVFLGVRNIWFGGIGRRFRAVRDNETNARAFAVAPGRSKLQAFAVAGFVTGIGGSLYLHSLNTVTSQSFLVDTSLTAVAVAAIGGIGFLGGPFIGAFYIIGVPRFLPLDNAEVAATQLGWLLLVLQFPGGVAASMAPLRERVVNAVARRHGLRGIGAERGTGDGDRQSPLVATRLPRPSGGPRRGGAHDEHVLVVDDVTKHFGGVRAVNGVSFDVRAGETFGLIGPNGAGKTTLFEIIGGFVGADRGRVLFNGEDVSRLRPEVRARRGLVRSFQDAALFPTLTVLECVELAFERTSPTRFAAALAGLQGPERARRRRADEVVTLMGLETYRDTIVAELSTGTRRVAELACLLALEPTVLLLDEPSSGIAQQETNALGELLRIVRDTYDMTLVVIEHDMPLIMGIADRIAVLGEGRLLTVGTPSEVRANPAVVESYLGGIPSATGSGVL